LRTELVLFLLLLASLVAWEAITWEVVGPNTPLTRAVSLVLGLVFCGVFWLVAALVLAASEKD
jgi:hypothetical protein